MNYRLLPTQISILLVFLIAPIWLKWPDAPDPFTSYYVLGFAISTLMLLSVLFWLLSGLQGWRNLFSGTFRMAFLGALVLLMGWSIISQEWAFGRNVYDGMAETAALQGVIIMGFVIVILAASPPPRFILMAIIASMLIQGTIGSLQVYFQHSIGLNWLGEFVISPTQMGVSVLEANGIRWLRPYGLTPHPNIFAGVIVLGLFASLGFLVQGKYRVLNTIVFLSGFFFLLLSFSRGAWIGFAVGALVALPFFLKQLRRIFPLFGLSIFIGLIFLWFYQPFLLSRAGLSEENTEQRSISDRLVFMEIAWDAITNYPIQGMGAGNFPWYASNYLFYRTDYDLRGNNVHNIYLTVWAELGLVGLGLFLTMLISGALAVKREPERIALLAGVVAWAVIGFVDHYAWTLVLSQSLWLGLLAAAIAKDAKASYNEEKGS